MKVKVTMRYALTAMTLAICSVQVTQAAIQKIKRVSKQGERNEYWTVSIYKWNGQDTGDFVSSSIFKKNTDGFRPDKLYFDFGEKNNIPNQIKIHRGDDEKYRTDYFVHQEIIQPFPPQKTLNLTLTENGNVMGLPKPISKTGSDRENKLITVYVPAGTWTVVSGELLTDNNMGDISSITNQFVLDTIKDITENSDRNDRLLRVYTKQPVSIAAKKAGVSKYKITHLKEAALKKIIDFGALEIHGDGSAHPRAKSATGRTELYSEPS